MVAYSKPMSTHLFLKRPILVVLITVLLTSGTLLVAVPSLVSAETKPGGTLKNDQPARIYTQGWWWTSIPDDLQFKVQTRPNFYSAVAISNRLSGEDFDLFAYSDYDMENLISSSTLGSDKVDFVVIDGHTFTDTYKYVKVSKFTGQDWTDGIRIESDYHCYKGDLYGSDPDANGTLRVGEYRYSMFEYHGTSTYSGTLRGDYPLINMYDIYMGAGGKYAFSITSVPSSEKLSMYLFKGSGNPDDALKSSKASSAGGSLSFKYEPEASGYYGLAVVDENNGYSSSDNYTLLVTSDFSMSAKPVSKLIAPGMSASYEVDVESFGTTKDINLHYRWRSATSNISTPSGAIAKLSASKVNTGGVGTEKVYLNVTTSSTMSPGTYYLTVYGNDTSINGAKKSTSVILRVSTSPDFFLSSSPLFRAISPGTSAKYTIDMATINSYTTNVTLSGSSIPSESSLTYSFSPNPINYKLLQSNLTISSTASTPKGDYLIVLKGTGGSLTRYANVTLKVQEPIKVQVVAPATGEIVSGVYTFKVKAGTPPTTDSVRFTFGGKMGVLGTLNAYYNSASGDWERTVNTFTFNDGACSMNITAVDNGGGVTIYGPVNFTLSNSPPNPVIMTPLDRTYVSGSSIPIKVNVTSYVISVRFRVDQNAWVPMTKSGTIWSGTYDSTLITDGEHTLSVEAKDSAGLTGISTLTLFIDNTKPTCAINSPINGQYIEGSYTFRTIATDTVKVHHVNLTIFGTTTTLPFNPITSSYEYTVTTSTMTDGKYEVYSTAYDMVGHSTQSPTVTFYIDNNPPSLSIDQPRDGEIIGGTYTIKITSSDTHLNKVEYMIDSGGWMSPTGAKPDWQVVLNTNNLRDGDHMLFVRAFDNASHKTEQSIEFTVDNTNPTCNIVSPYIGAFIEGVVTFKVSSADTVGIEKVIIKTLGNTYQMTYNLQSGYYEYTANTIPLPDGNYSALASSYDLSGKKTNSSSIYYNIDNQYPSLTVNGIQNGDYLAGTIAFNVTVSDVYLQDTRYSVDGGGWVGITTPWDTTKVLDGAHTLTIMARDRAGHSTTQTFNIKVDNHKPVCAVNGPVPNEYLKGTYKFRVSASDSVGIDRVEINVFDNNFTAIYSSVSGYYEFTSDTTIQSDGNYTCYAIVYDLSGWMNTSTTVKFRVDNNAPVLQIMDPIEGSYLEGIVTMNVKATDVFLDKVEYDVDGSGWVLITTKMNTSNYGDGGHRISFRALDLAGHITSTSINVKVDNNNPTGSISTPVSLQYVEGTAKFSAIASDVVGVASVRITIFGSTIDMSYNSAAGTYEYWTDTRLITDGTYNMTVTIKDLSGKTLVLGPRTFYVDNNAPVLRINYPLVGAYLDGFETMDVTATDTFLDRVEYNVDGSGWVLISTLINTTQFGDGYHMISFRALDKAGHSTTSGVGIYIDNTDPTGSISAPVTGQYLEGTSLFSIIASDKVGVSSVMITVFGSTLTMNYNSGTGTYEYRTDTRLIPDGTYNMTVTITDLSSKTFVLGPRTFYVDNNLPVLRIVHPIEGAFLDGYETMLVNATDVFLEKVEYNIDGTGWVEIDQTLNTTMFNDGVHIIQFHVFDRAGHQTTALVNVKIDNNAPTGTITAPVEGQYLEGTPLFSVIASDQVGLAYVKVKIFGATIDMSYNSGTGSYEYHTDTRLIPDGTYNMTVIIRDLSGKTTVIGPRGFYVDNNAPVIRIIHPVEGSYLEGTENMNVSVTDVFLDKVEYNVDGTGWVLAEVPLNTTLFSDGEHLIEFRAVDKAGHTTMTSSEVVIDNTIPYGAIASPLKAQFIGGSYLFKVVASDLVGIRSVRVTVFNSTLDMNYNTGTGYYEYTTDTSLILDGIYNLTITIVDLSGKVTIVGPRDFYLDNHIPVLEVYNLNDDDILSDHILFDYFANDTFLDVVEYEVDSTGWYDISVPLNTSRFNDGAHIIRIRAVDLSDKSITITFDVKFDNIGPTCTVNSPVENEFVGGVITIKVTAFDIVGIDYVMIKVYDLEVKVPYNSQTGYYEYTANTITWGSGEDGIRNITAIAYDHTGKSYTYGPVSFNVDNRAPTININSPKDGQVVSGLFFFNVNNADVFKKGTDYNIDGASWQPVSIGWNTLLIPDGLHEVNIRATDLAGHVTLVTIHVYVDNNAPEITMVTPSEGEYIQGTYVIRIVAFDAVGIERVMITIAGKEMPLSYNTQTGYFEHIVDTRLYEDGTYIASASVTDVADRTVTTPDVNFKVDNEYPTLRVESPVRDQLVTGTIALRAQTTDTFPGAMKYAIDHTTWYDISVPWNTSKVMDGYHTVTVMTEDQAGHRTEFNVDVIVDNGKPVISQSSITSGQVLSGITTLMFYVYDTIGIGHVTLSVDDSSPFEVYRGEGGFYYEYMLNTNLLADGEHILTVTALDKVGNSMSSAYSIRIDNTGPAITLDYYWVEGDDQVRIGSVKEGRSVIFVATVDDPSGVSTVMINIDSLGWWEMTQDENISNPNTYKLYWPTSGGGAHMFQVRSIDKLGNENKVSGLINVKEVKDKYTVGDFIRDALPYIWLLLFIILVIALLLLLYFGVLTKWAKGEGYKPKEKKGLEAGGDKPKKAVPLMGNKKEGNEPDAIRSTPKKAKSETSEEDAFE